MVTRRRKLREEPHLPRMAAETGRVAADNPVAPGVELAAA